MPETNPTNKVTQENETELVKYAIEKQKNGDYALAEKVYEEVLVENPNNIQAMHYLSKIYLNNNHSEKAIPLLSKALEFDRQNASLYYNLGLAFHNCNEWKAAIHNYQQAIKLNPNFSMAYNNLGLIYQQQGNIAFANSSFKNAFRNDANCVEAYFNYSQTYKFTQTDKILINNIETLVQRNLGNPPALSKLHFTLGKIYSDLKQYRKGLSHYEQANQLKFQGYDCNALERYTDEIISTFSPDFFNKLSVNLVETKKRFIFVVGMPESGTTLVEQIIAAHPLVTSGGETGFIGDIIDELPDLTQSDLSYPQCITQFSPELINQIAMRFNAYLNNLSGNFVNITDNSPINYLHLGLIQIFFPQSIIINVERNPVATCLGCYFKDFDHRHQYTYNLAILARVFQNYQKIMNHWKAIMPENIYSINYENLLSHSDTEINLLISRCRLNWDESCEKVLLRTQTIDLTKDQTQQVIFDNSQINDWKNYQKYIEELMGLLD